MRHIYYKDNIVKHKGLWYVIGHCGGKYWMPISNGYKTKAEALERLPQLARAQISANAELRDI